MKTTTRTRTMKRTVEPVSTSVESPSDFETVELMPAFPEGLLNLNLDEVGDLHDSRVFYRWLEGQFSTDGQDSNPHNDFLLGELDERGVRIQKMGTDIEQLRERLLEREVQRVRLKSELNERERELCEAKRELTSLADRYRGALQLSTEARRRARELEQEVEQLRDKDARHAQSVALLNARLEELMCNALALEEAGGAPFISTGDTQQRLATSDMRAERAEAAAEAAETRLADALSRLSEAEVRAADAEIRRCTEGDRYREMFGEKDSLIRSLQKQLADKTAENAHLHAEMSSWPVRGARSLHRLWTSK